MTQKSKPCKLPTVSQVQPRTDNGGRRYSRWFRFYTSVVHDPKVQKLRPELFRAWVNCLCMAAENGGIVPLEDLDFQLRMTPEQVNDSIDTLTLAGLLDWVPITNGERTGDVVLKPHHWDERQYKWDGRDPTAAERKRRQRNKPTRNDVSRSCHGHVTVGVTEIDSESVSDSVSASSLGSRLTRKSETVVLGGTVEIDNYGRGDIHSRPTQQRRRKVTP